MIPACRLTVLPLLLLAALVQAEPLADREREQRLANQIAEAIFDGETLWLTGDDGHDFFAILQETDSAPARGGVVLLHGRGFHPDWEDVIHPLRVGLVAEGWNTLSIQLPVLGKDARYFDYVPVFPESIPRIERAIAYLREQGNERVVVLAHSCGYHMAQHWLLERGSGARESIDGFVGIGMGATDYGQPMMEPFVLDRLAVPVLDVYGAEDFPAVRRYAAERRAQMDGADNPLSRQVEVPEADHYFKDTGDRLLEVVAEWLQGL